MVESGNIALLARNVPHGVISPTARYILLMLATYAWDKDTVWPSLLELAMSFYGPPETYDPKFVQDRKNKISIYLRELENANLIWRGKIIRDGKRLRIYKFNMELLHKYTDDCINSQMDYLPRKAPWLNHD